MTIIQPQLFLRSCISGHNGKSERLITRNNQHLPWKSGKRGELTLRPDGSFMKICTVGQFREGHVWSRSTFVCPSMFWLVIKVWKYFCAIGHLIDWSGWEQWLEWCLWWSWWRWWWVEGCEGFRWPGEPTALRSVVGLEHDSWTTSFFSLKPFSHHFTLFSNARQANIEWTV